MRPIYIFDIDGTLADITHRLHFIQGEKKDWPGFFAACADDKPIWPVIELLQRLRDGGCEIWIWTGRSEEVREQTLLWLRQARTGFGPLTGFPIPDPDKFRMRRKGDHRPDHEIKSEWLSEVEPPEYKRLAGVFEDRQQVVDMWRKHGLTCYQVAKGDF